VKQAIRLACVGSAGGLVAAVALTKLMTRLLYAVKPNGPPTFFYVVVIVFGVALLASYIPAPRATQ
jgi:hypothetical protein